MHCSIHICLSQFLGQIYSCIPYCQGLLLLVLPATMIRLTCVCLTSLLWLPALATLEIRFLLSDIFDNVLLRTLGCDNVLLRILGWDNVLVTAR
jgi:hypothetical protein